MTDYVVTEAFVCPSTAGGDGVKEVIGYGTGPTTNEAGGSSIDLTDYFSGTIDHIHMTSGTANRDFKFIAGTNYAARARGTITLTGIATADDTFVINATTITAKATADAGGSVDYFDIGAGTAAEQVTNIVATLKEGSEATNIDVWDGAGNTVVIEWTAGGANAGSLITFTESLDNATIDGGGTLIGPMLMATDGAGTELGGVSAAVAVQFVAYGRAKAAL
jgi:hypothetical protein